MFLDQSAQVLENTTSCCLGHQVPKIRERTRGLRIQWARGGTGFVLLGMIILLDHSSAATDTTVPA